MLLPFIKTVQARHWPSPQPYLVPVSCKSSRRTSSNGRWGSVVTVRDLPLTVKVMVASIIKLGSLPLYWTRPAAGGFKFSDSSASRSYLLRSGEHGCTFVSWRVFLWTNRYRNEATHSRNFRPAHSARAKRSFLITFRGGWSGGNIGLSSARMAPARLRCSARSRDI